MSSGGPLLNEQLEVFAINFGGFYDKPGLFYLLFIFFTTVG
jgi:hypothetical protein